MCRQAIALVLLVTHRAPVKASCRECCVVRGLETTTNFYQFIRLNPCIPHQFSQICTLKNNLKHEEIRGIENPDRVFGRRYG
jgi:hypothetical protein